MLENITLEEARKMEPQLAEREKKEEEVAELLELARRNAPEAEFTLWDGRGEVPVGAVIMRNGQVLADQLNQARAGCRTAFAQAATQLDPMGTGLLRHQARIERIGTNFDCHKQVGSE